MELKNKVLLAVLIAAILIGGGWLFGQQSDSTNLQNPPHAKYGICGPNEMSIDYDVFYCDHSCSTSTDCQYSCGCGAINKDETCHDEGIKYDCVDHEVTCKAGKCILGEESIPSVSIKTDKTTYSQGENIEITARNGLDFPILYYGGERFWDIEHYENSTWTIPAYDAGGWFQLAEGNIKDACYVRMYERAQPEPLSSGSEISQIWNQKICPYSNEAIAKPRFVKYFEPGRYRLAFSYSFNVSSRDSFNIEDPETVYSNEFTING